MPTSALRACVAALVTLLAVQGAEARGPFASLAGTWAGRGTITMPSGTQERLRCRASYIVTPGGEALTQILRCASDSYQIDLESNVVDQGGLVSGTWTETTRGASGTMTGTVRGPVIAGTISGAGLTATLLLVTHGRAQSVSIRLQGSDIAGVAVAFRRVSASDGYAEQH
jgi:hypothetical protein